MTLGPFAFASRRASQCSRLYRSLVIFVITLLVHIMVGADDDFDRVLPLTNMTFAELVAFDVSCRSRRRVSSHRVVQGQAHPVIDLPYPTLQTRDAFLATDQRTQEWISTVGRRVDKQYGALAQRYRHFGLLDGVETTATPLEIGSLICFGLVRGMQLRMEKNRCP
ncbi:BQ5605_C002g01272 [Microbotryum silenes-dioicae]|uniref:BQ5605_C002g01272 protein n=1 Tax=Microbotryum silenes-dioicae TaxID=796604 RepID=A0A2X0M247_9BASI|nr:BQ5605_C002g01272 [Microbotryum silenes-dioicae]